MKRFLILIVGLFLLNSTVIFALSEGYQTDSPTHTAFVGIKTFDSDTYPERTGAYNVYIRGYSADTTLVQPIVRIFDNQEFEYINNATATDSVVIAINKTGELKVFENELYNITIVRFGLDVSPIPAGEDSPGLLGKIKSITYTKP